MKETNAESKSRRYCRNTLITGIVFFLTLTSATLALSCPKPGDLHEDSALLGAQQQTATLKTQKATVLRPTQLNRSLLATACPRGYVYHYQSKTCIKPIR